MKISDLIKLLIDVMGENGDREMVGIANGTIYTYIDINCPDDNSPAYLELCD
jgi:hypothetical protein